MTPRTPYDASGPVLEHRPAHDAAARFRAALAAELALRGLAP